MDVYSHVVPAMQREAMNGSDKLLGVQLTLGCRQNKSPGSTSGSQGLILCLDIVSGGWILNNDLRLLQSIMEQRHEPLDIQRRLPDKAPQGTTLELALIGDGEDRRDALLRHYNVVATLPHRASATL